MFHGPHQNKFTAEMVVAWQPLGDRVRFIQSSKTGKNALDFHIAFCLGQAFEQDKAASQSAKYIVISKDGGFDALFDYVRSINGLVVRAASIPEALKIAKQLQGNLSDSEFENQAAVAQLINEATENPQVLKKKVAKKAVKKAAKKAAKKTTPNGSSALQKVIAHLRANPKNRPATVEKLENHIPCMVGGKVPKEMVSSLMELLVHDGFAIITDKKVEYKIPKAKKKAKKS